MRLYIYLAAALMLIGSHSAAMHYGMVFERDKANASIHDYQERVNKLKASLQEAKQHREVVYRDRVKVIREAADECLDRRMPDSVLTILREDPAG